MSETIYGLAMDKSTTATTCSGHMCNRFGKICSLATDLGYCQVSACTNHNIHKTTGSYDSSDTSINMNTLYNVGDYVIYVNGDRYELGKIKRIVDDGAFIWYHEGSTAAKTPFDCMHKLTNSYVIKETSLNSLDS